MGLSYAAHAQMALGVLDPPGLAAQFLDCGGFSNAYRNALADARDPAVKAALAAQDIATWQCGFS
jgi:predicted acyl esterase